MPKSTMHGGAQGGAHEDHLVVAMFESESKVVEADFVLRHDAR
jgi:hypothetical protein